MLITRNWGGGVDGRRNIYGNSILYVQFFYKPKNQSINLKKSNATTVGYFNSNLFKSSITAFFYSVSDNLD